MNRTQCDAIRPLISAALDGELDEDEFVRLSEHLAGCPSCRQVHQDYYRLRDDLRTEPAPAPPPELSRTIYKETVEKPPPPRIVRFVSRTGMRVGMSTVAASIVILIIISMVGVHSYDQRTSPPVVLSSQPTQESEQLRSWPVTEPIIIEFDKPMNRDSVKQNLIIRPHSDQDPVPMGWEGNRLIIGRSDTHTTMLKPNTDYTITILPGAEDRYGNPLDDYWVLKFKTGPPHVSVATPPAGRESSDDDSTTVADSSEDSFFSSQESGSPEASSEEDDSVTRDESEVQASQPPSNSGNDEDQATQPPSDAGNDEDQGERPSPTEVATEVPTAPSDTEEGTPGPTAVPTEPAPTATPEPEPTNTPRPEPTATATPSPTQPPTSEPIPVRGAFGEVYWGNSEIEDALGKPTQEAFSYVGSEQGFQRGLMLQRHDRDRGAIFVLVNEGAARTYDNSYNSEVHDFPSEDLGNGLHAPGGAFGKVWAENGLVDLIGNAVSSAPAEHVDASIQQFDRGQMVYSRGMVYVIFENGNWQVFPDRSGGFQGDDQDEDGESDAEDGSYQEETPESEVPVEPEPEQPVEDSSDDLDEEEAAPEEPEATATPEP